MGIGNAMLRLLASPRLELGDTHHDVPDSAPGYLLAYLATRADWVRREEVATLMWPDASEGAAQHNLRVNLNRLRPLLARWSVDGALAAEQRRLRVALPSDVAALRDAHAAADWPAAAAVSHGGFLESLSFRAFPVLGEWARTERQALLELWRDSLQRAVPALPPSSMLELARRYRAVDPIDEAVLRILIEASVAADQHAEAALSYRRFVEELQREYCERPSEDLQLFAHRLLGTRVDSSAATADLAAAKAPRPSLSSTGKRLRASSMVGRDAECRVLRDEALRVVMLAGAEGMGKTRLLAEVLPRACWFHGREEAAQVPLAPVAEWIDDHRDALPPLDGEFYELRRLLPADGDAEVMPVDAADRVMPRLLAAAAALAESMSTTIVIDDAQWIDAATARFAMLVVRRGHSRLVVAFRSAQLNEDAANLVAALQGEIDGAATIVLRPLTSAALGELVAGVTGMAAAQLREPAEWLTQRCGGNPFFGLELLQSLAEQPPPKGDLAGWTALLTEASRCQAPSAVPARLVDLIRRRLKRLSAVTQRVLGTAAIVGDFRHAGALAAATGVSPWTLSQSLDEAIEAGLIDGERFAHDLFREAIRSAIAPSVARMLHAQVAEAFAANLAAEQLAYHWWQAVDTERALGATLDAVERARLRGLHVEALPLVERALDRDLGSMARGRLLAARALLLQELADADGAARDAAAALDEAVAPADRARALVVQARLAYQSGSASRAGELLTEAAQSNAQDADLLRLRTQLALVDGESHRQVEALQHEIAALRAIAPGLTLISALTGLGAIHDENGEPERGLPLHQEALNLARKLNARSVQVDVAINLLWCLTALPGRAAEGFAIGEHALEVGEYDGSDTLRNNLAWAYADSGRLAEALALYRTLTRSRDPTLACIAWSKVVDLQARLAASPDARDEAVEHLLQAMPRTDFYVSHASAIVAALNHGSDGQAKRALAWLRPAQEVDPWLQEKLDAAMESRGFGRRG